MATRLALLGLLFAALPALALEVAGVNLEEKVQVEGRELQLNGAGLRKKAFFRVYVVGLYLGEKKTVAAEALAAPGAKRVLIVMLRDVDADDFVEALMEGLSANNSAAEMKAFEPRVKQLHDIINAIKEAKKGMRVALDGTAAGTQVLVDGKPVGAIAGEDFYRALMKIWLGEKAVQADVKRALLGEKS
jgi:hypothetical protein